MATQTVMQDDTSAKSGSQEQVKWYSPRFGTDPMFSPLGTLFSNVDTKDRILIIVFFILALVGYLMIQMYNNYAFQDESFICAIWSTYSGASIGTDIIVFGVAFFIWFYNDHKFYGFSIYTFSLFFIFSLGGAIGIMAPLYYGLRVSRASKMMNQTNNKSGQTVPQEEEQQQLQDENPQRGFGFYLSHLAPVILFLIVMIWFIIGVTPFPDPGVCKNYSN